MTIRKSESCEGNLRLISEAHRKRILQHWGVFRGSDGLFHIPSGPIKLWSVDVDVNLFQGLGGVKVRNKRSGKLVLLSNYEFARERDRMEKGTSRFKLLPGQKSFINYRTGSGSPSFKSQIQKMIRESRDHAWTGPAWIEFALNMKNIQTAGRTHFITSRGNTDIAEGIEKTLVKEGYLDRAPVSDLVFAVMTPFYEEQFKTWRVPIRKRMIIYELLDLLESILTSEEKSFGFSDDDTPMLNEVRDGLLEESYKGRWPSVKIVLFYTGLGDESILKIKNGKLVSVRSRSGQEGHSQQNKILTP